MHVTVSMTLPGWQIAPLVVDPGGQVLHGLHTAHDDDVLVDVLFTLPVLHEVQSLTLAAPGPVE